MDASNSMGGFYRLMKWTAAEVQKRAKSETPAMAGTPKTAGAPATAKPPAKGEVSAKFLCTN